tara:strand:- start:7858 stop:10104 length:2247 start_codon:yes stop_codon:yes gene_type:complete
MLSTFIKQILTIQILCLALLGASQESYEVVSAGFNTSGKEYSPQYYQGGIVFCSDQIQTESITYQDSETGKPLTDLFYVKCDSNTFGVKELFSLSISSSFHEGPITFTKDFRTAYFTRSHSLKRRFKNMIKSKNHLGVYKTTFNGEKWGDVIPCSFNSFDYNVGQPTLSEDETVLYLVSDKEGGIGGKDIYYSNISGDSCSELINVGSSINTKYNEMFPFSSSTKMMYFSSDKPSGKGGLDIYQSSGEFESWSTPIALDSSINSSHDDFSMIFNSENTEGYFSSNRNGSDDIFKINVSFPPFKNCEEILGVQLCYEFFEEATINVDSISMVYEWDFGDGNREEGTEVYHCYENPGHYLVSLNIKDPLIDNVFVNQDIYDLEIEAVSQPEISCPDSIPVDSLFKITVKQGGWKDYFIEAYYIDYRDSYIMKNNTKIHKYSSAGSVEVKVLIAGTDKETGKIQTNCFYKLVKVVDNDYTKVKKHLKVLDYESFEPPELIYEDNISYALEILTNHESVIKDSTVLKEYYKKVLEFFDEESTLYSYVYGNVKDPLELLGEYKKAHKSGFNTASVKKYKNEVIDSRKFESLTVEDLDSLSELGVVTIDIEGKTEIILDKIFFKFSAYQLSENSKLELNKLVEYLNNNLGVEITINAYTDAARNVDKAKIIFKRKGLTYSKEAHDKMSSFYNNKLSKNRAVSVYIYLIQKGISKSRLDAVGHGENKPVAPNYFPDGSDNADGRMMNRRVSFTIK